MGEARLVSRYFNTHTHIRSGHLSFISDVLVLYPSFLFEKQTSIIELTPERFDKRLWHRYLHFFCGYDVVWSDHIWSLWFHVLYLQYVPWRSYVVKLIDWKEPFCILLQQCQTNFKVVWHHIQKPVLIQIMMQNKRLNDSIDALRSPITPCGKKLMFMPVL